MQNANIRQRYMDFFAIYGYAMIYVAAYCFKTEFDRQNGSKSKPSEENLIVNSIGFAMASALYGTGLLKMAGQGKILPNP